MSKQHRVIEVAKEFHMSGKEAVAILKKAGFDVKNNFSAVDDAGYEVVKKAHEAKKATEKKEKKSDDDPMRFAVADGRATHERVPHKASEKKKLTAEKKTVKASTAEPKKPEAEVRPVKEKTTDTQKASKTPKEGKQTKGVKETKNKPAGALKSAAKETEKSKRKVLRASDAPRLVIVRQADKSNERGASRGNMRSAQVSGERKSRGGGRIVAAAPAAPMPPRDGGQGSGRRTERGGDRKNSGRGERRNERGRNNYRSRMRPERMDRKNRKGRKAAPPQPKVEIARPKHIKLPETIAVKDLASKMSYTAAEVIKKLFLMGVMATINQEIDYDTAVLVASEFDVTCEELPPEVDPTEIPEVAYDPKMLRLRPPVVTVMGHVDHGKTSLLDCIRNTSVSTHEAGGITQHIGAYQVMANGKKIVFLDTPGHEAFTAMRARGAQITDIAILVVAADDGVMPQTIEAIHHAKSAKVPIIVAINKIDKPGANPERVKQELMEQGLVPEEYGGDTIMVPVSAKKQMGIDDLLEMVLLVAEVKELKANPNTDARGVIIEAKLDKGRGPVATVLMQDGTLRIGESIVVGMTYGKVRAMINDRGEAVKKAGPSMPVEILGLSDVPSAGDILAALDEKQARSIAEARIERQRSKLIKSKKVSLDDLFHQIQENDIKELNIVVKADVQGSVEALSSALINLNKNDEVRVAIVHSGVGNVSESDVMLASASNALIIAFNVRPAANVRRLADSEKIDIRTYSVIYDALNDVKDAMSGLLAPKYKEVVIGRVEIRQVMKFSKALVAGSYVLDGKITNNAKIRILRDDKEIFDGDLDSLRRFKDEVKEVAAGYECGISIIDFTEFQEGDIIEPYIMEEIKTDINQVNKEAAKKHEEEAKAKAEAAAKKAMEAAEAENQEK